MDNKKRISITVQPGPGTCCKKTLHSVTKSVRTCKFGQEGICPSSKSELLQILFRLYIVLFTVSVSTITLSCDIVNIHGLFGEVKSSIATKESKALKEERRQNTSAEENSVKGINIFNGWFYIVIIILCLTCVLYAKKLPLTNTIVTFKVRMND